jgi:hypothetical protein
MSRTDDLLTEIRDSLAKNQRGNSSGERQYTPPSTPVSTGIDAIDKAASKVNGLSNAFDGVLQDWQTATKTFGINWNNDAIGLTTSIAKSRMSMAEWSEAIASSKSGFTGLGGTMNESAKIFTSVATGFRDSGASEALAKMAWSTGEQNKLLAMSMTSQRHLDLSKREDQERLFESTHKMAQEMDKVSQLTGMSRKDQLDKMEENKNDIRFMANKRLLEAEGKGAGASAIEDFAKSAGGLNSIIKNYSQGGVLTDANRATAQAIGPDLAEKLRLSVLQLQNSRSEAEAEANRQRLQQVKDEIAVRVNSTASLKDAVRGESDVSEARRTLMKDSNQAILNEGDGIKRRAKDLGISQEEAQKMLAKEAILASEGKNARGEMYAGAQTTEGLVKAKRAVEDAAKVPQDIAKAINERVGKAAATPDKEGLSVNDKLSTIDKKTGEAMSDKIYGDLGKDLTKSINNGTFIKDLGSMLEKGAVQGLSNIKSIAAGVVQLTGNITGVYEGGSHAGGTKAAFGDWFGKDFGPDGMGVLAHGREALVPEGKAPEFVADMLKTMGGGNQASIIENMMNSVSMTSSNLMNQMPQPTIEPVNQAPQVTQEPSSGASDITLKDINEQLATLNTSMVKLISTTSDMLETTDKQYRATKQLSPNLNAR